MNKKKYHGGLKVLLLLLFIMLLGMFSTCYANDYTDFEIPIEWFNALIEYVNQNSSANDYISSFSLNATSLKSCYDNQVKASLKTLVESVGGDERNTVCFIKYPTSSSDSYMYLYFIISNNSLNNVSNQYKVQPSSTYFDIYKDDSSITSTVKSIRISKSGSYQLYNASSVDYATLGWKKAYVTYNGDTTTIENGPFFGLNQKPLNLVHYYLNGQYQYFFIDGFYNIQPTATPIPTPVPTPVPTPTSAPDVKDYSGQLTEIKDTISGEAQATRENDDKNTEQIVNAISGEGQAIRDTLTDYDEELADDTISNFISNMQDSISGELSNSQIIGALEEVEDGFIDLISGQAEDFVISWNDVRIDSIHNNDNKVLNHASGSSSSFLNGSILLSSSADGVLIPAGQVNFSKACRENSTLRNVKEKLNIILSALCGIALVKYLYNLLLATLGIDNPYLYDKVKDEHVNNSGPNVRVTAKVPYISYDKNGNKEGWGRDEK